MDRVHLKVSVQLLRRQSSRLVGGMSGAHLHHRPLLHQLSRYELHQRPSQPELEVPDCQLRYTHNRSHRHPRSLGLRRGPTQCDSLALSPLLQNSRRDLQAIARSYHRYNHLQH